MITISGNKIFSEGFLTEDSWVKLWYGYHSKERLEERGKGSLCVHPEEVKITKKNLMKGYIDNGKLVKFVIKIAYTPTVELYLVLTDSYYMAKQYFVKSLWFREISKRKKRRHAPQYNIQHSTNTGITVNG
jgi:hypothetical protein